MSMDLFVTLSWTTISFTFVILGVYGIVIASAEERDTQDEVMAQAARLTPNGILIIGLQQASAARILKWCHAGCFTHQTIGFLIGCNSLYLLLVGIDGADTPTTDLGPVQEYFVPILFLLMLCVICAVQFGLIQKTYSQRKARLDLRALEMDDDDTFKKVAADIARRLSAFEKDFRKEHDGRRDEHQQE